MSDSEFIAKEPCPECGSKDNLARYSDGHAYCFGCEYYEPGEGEEGRPSVKKAGTFEPVPGEVRALKKRGITQETCQKFGYKVGRFSGSPAHICDVRNADGVLVAQKVRLPDKSFFVVGSLDSKPLIGMHLWSGGKKLVITEGEIDMLSLSQVQGNKWPVVSLPNGAKSAKKVLSHNLDYLASFEEVILAFDMDEPGRAAAKEAAEIIMSVTNVKIMKMELKDANEMLLAGKVRELINAVFTAETFKPDGLVTMDDIFELALKPVERGLAWWLPDLDNATYGRRYGEIHVLGAGTGMGKTDFLIQQIEFDLWTLGLPVGVFFLEQPPAETAKRIAGKHDGAQYHVPRPDLDQDKLRETLTELRNLRLLHFYDNFGQCDWSLIKAKILYLISLGIRVFYIDHLTALATGGEKAEKEELEAIMGDIAEFAKAHEVLFILVSHLTTPEGKSHEEGGRVTIRQFKGSRAIGFWSYFMYGMERNQQAEDVNVRHTTIFRILKDRLTGQSVGSTFALGYSAETGRLYPKPPEVEDEEHFEDEDPPF